jgi:hypothetical protein
LERTGQILTGTNPRAIAYLDADGSVIAAALHADSCQYRDAGATCAFQSADFASGSHYPTYGACTTPGPGKAYTEGRF